MREPEFDLQRPETWPASAREYLARHRPPPGDTRLRDALREEIRAGRPMTFARFMERALYDPEHGYYASAGRVGAGGDFVTSPTTHPAFGALLCRRLRQLWRQQGRPDPFILAEAGAGTGALAAQILGAWGMNQRDTAGANRDRQDRQDQDKTALRYTLIEPFAAWREVQERELAEWGDRVSWCAELEQMPQAPHLLLANELLDALPVHRVVRREGGLRELYVAVDERGELAESEGPLSTEELKRYFDRLGLQPPVNTPVEANLAALEWLRRALAAARGGWIWLLDYGAVASELYAAPRAGTLRAFHDHALSTDPLVRVGGQDLTTDVDFTSLIHAAEEAGWVVEEYVAQRELLLSLGWREWLGPGVPAFRRSGGVGVGRRASGAGKPSPTPIAQRLTPDGPQPGNWALLQLIDPDGLGAIRSLLLRDGRRQPADD